MKHQEQIEKLGRAIKRAAEAHGHDNGFTAGELCDQYGAPWSLITGRLLQHELPAVEQAAGYRLRYTRGRPCYLRVIEPLTPGVAS